VYLGYRLLCSVDKLHLYLIYKFYYCLFNDVLSSLENICPDDS
jgi:hypothetical protein